MITQKMKRLGLATLAATMIVGSLTILPTSAYADTVWNRWQAAEKLVAKGNKADAVPHWKFLAEHYASVGNWDNAALFSGNLNAYYDSIGDYDQAITYYELENKYWTNKGTDWGFNKLQRADQIRTTVELYRQDDHVVDLKALAAPKNGKLAKFEPAYGTYLGMYAEQDPKTGNRFNKVGEVYGKDHAIYLAYAHWPGSFPMAYAQHAKDAGGALQIAWEPDNGLDPVVDGEYLRKWARDAKAAGIPIFLRFAGEMNGNWVKWHGNPSQYIEKFRMLHDVFAKEAPNVAMVWSPGDVPADTIDAYYPGDDYVDWVGVSLYIEPYANGDLSLPSMLQTSNVERLTKLYNTYADRKPLMLSETGVPHYSHSAKEDFTDWAKLNLQRLYEIMPYKYPRLKAITYFNVDQQMKNAKNDYTLSTSASIQSYYSKLIANPFLLSKVSDGAAPEGGIGYVKVDAEHESFSKKAKFVPFVKIPDVYIGKIEYVLNGQVIATQTELPYGLELDAGDVMHGSVLELRVYNKSGEKVASKSFGIAPRVNVMINGKEQVFKQPPLILNGSTMAPLRAIFEAMGAVVKFDEATQTVTAQKGSTSLKLTVNEKIAYVNGQFKALDQPAQLVNGFTLAPARFVGELFGGNVTWDGKTQTVVITTK
ncbi:stalk domain-containing protein [Paenibacillus sp. N1-5-1-14]|uniref:stalk domain-containing protein n=1 Tax=Paenibacillus radicibacter TaxID=2972488 RepID=UPI00215992CC|nr:stalk domain-containing protein [Paenibacillus radicibacter]MCR8645129.1 stalk domain-containing protein [Paenibacillus radicibacter]